MYDINENNTTMTEESTNNVQVYDNNQQESNDSGSGIGALLGVVGVVGAAGAAAWHFTKDWRQERQIKKLEKKGFVVSKPEPAEEGVKKAKVKKVEVEYEEDTEE